MAILAKKIEEKAEGIELDLQNNDESHWIIPIKSILLGKNKKKDENIDFDKDTKIKGMFYAIICVKLTVPM